MAEDRLPDNAGSARCDGLENHATGPSVQTRSSQHHRPRAADIPPQARRVQTKPPANLDQTEKPTLGNKWLKKRSIRN